MRLLAVCRYFGAGDQLRQKRIKLSIAAEWYFDWCQQSENLRENCWLSRIVENLLLKPGSSAMSREAKVMPMPCSTIPSTPSVELRLNATL